VTRKRWRWLVPAGIVLFCLMVNAATAAAPAIRVRYLPITYYFGDVQYAPPEDQQGFLYNNRTYLPLRFVAHSLNLSVSWDGKSRTVAIRTPTRDEQAAIESDNEENRNRARQAAEAGIARETLRSVSAVLIPVTYDLFGEKVETPPGMEAIMLNNRLFVPVRFLADALGYPVEWDQAAKTVRVALPPILPEDEVGGPDEPSGEQDAAQSGDSAGTLPLPAAGGGGGSSVQKPTADELKRQAESKISSLKSKCESRMNSLFDQYKASSNKDERSRLISDGWAELAACDAEFDAIMQELSDRLSENGYPTDVVNWYWDRYEAVKEEKFQEVLGNLND